MRIDKTSFISPNFKERRDDVDMVVIHSTHMNSEDSLERLCNKEAEVSCHYLIDLEGKIFQLVPEDKVAYHAGVSYWSGREKLNLYSIGIELVDIDNHGNLIKEFPEKQIGSLIKILQGVAKRYDIPPSSIVAHSDIAPDRKDDPGEYFTWRILYESGFGIFPEYKPQDLGGFLVQTGDEGEDVARVQGLLKEYGYKVSVDGVFGKSTKDVIVAFKRHFDARVINDIFDEVSLAILEEICTKKRSTEV